MKVKWVRILGVIAAVFVLFLYGVSSRDIVGYPPHNSLIIFYLALIILPSFLAVFLTAFGRFWWSFSINLWLLFVAIMNVFDSNASPKTVILVLAIATVCTTPFLNRACMGRKKPDEFGQTNKQADTQ